ncbi:MAG: hypothetical protein CMC08_09835 [Flavobacteriaceae bacterium]|nr:hypothetical protein [Flavobacteriaceae bacterium]
MGCSSSKLVNEWRNPETPAFMAGKILIVGISPDIEMRRTFETHLANELEKHDMIAVRSVDFFESSFTTSTKSEAQLSLIENQLVEAGFDAVLFSKVVGSESKVTLVKAFRNMEKTFASFRDYYYENQDVYQREMESYQVYNTETLLYCICPHRDRELLWRGEIDVVAPSKTRKSIADYVRTLLTAFEEQQLLVIP